MKLSIVCLAKDEAANVAKLVTQLSRQTLLTGRALPNDLANGLAGDLAADMSGNQSGAPAIDVLMVANGCNDDTAARTEACRPMLAGLPHVSLTVHDLPQGGKSRSWNRAVHEFTDPASDYLLFLDADVDLLDDAVMADLLRRIAGDSKLRALSGLPAKDAHGRQDKTLTERLSLLISRNTRSSGSISGGLYIIRGAVARAIWLPNETPGEDGFLNAMVNTAGFSEPHAPGRVAEADRLTHYFETIPPRAFFGHERRLIVGTMVNRWIFEHLWSLKLAQPAGPLIAQWNAERPQWIQDIIDRNVAGKRWLIPREIVLRRFKGPKALGWLKFAAYLPLSILGTLMMLPAAIMANGTLKRQGSSSVW